ncbi:DUF4389 domain-containing protein [Candidatus Poriferisocius sp.]|uniref:DUF4389 domain-containing protein n=1 Tax=Candidatus Poriferisocius sp. TaxID=3101276 RepID=UPI003B58BFEA
MNYPATLSLDAPLKVGRWRVIGNLILAIPHLILVYVLLLVSYVVELFSWLAIVFTGRLPAGLADVSCMMIRYYARTSVYVGFMRTSYPPFDFSTTPEDNGADPEVTVSFAPELDGRSRLSVLFRFILIIPVMIAALFWMLLGLLASVAGFFAVLVLGRWPEGLRNFLVGVNRFHVRANAYWALLTDHYPPLGISE